MNPALRSLQAMAAVALAGSASAEIAAGPPPWTCHVAAACDAGGCTSLPGMLTSLRIEAGERANTLRLDGRNAGHYATVDEARAAVKAGAIPRDAALVLVEDLEGVADAVGLSAYAPSSRVGMLDLSETYASLVCTGA